MAFWNTNTSGKLIETRPARLAGIGLERCLRVWADISHFERVGQMATKRKKKIPKLPDGCGYMGYEFGGGYIDSECFGGQLYDLDNCDGPMLYKPMEYLHCPNCQTNSWLERQAEMVGEGVHGREKSSLPQWKAACRFILKTNRDAALPLLNGKFKTVTYLEENDAGDDLIDRQWMFNEAELTEA